MYTIEETFNYNLVSFDEVKRISRFICFLGETPNVLIQDYLWSSSNSSILIVDEYGIVYAKSIAEPCLVTITCVYKYNKLFSGTITFEVYPNN